MMDVQGDECPCYRLIFPYCCHGKVFTRKTYVNPFVSESSISLRQMRKRILIHFPMHHLQRFWLTRFVASLVYFLNQLCIMKNHI